jgi:hypothetical protein
MLRHLLRVTEDDAFQFFLEHLKDVTESSEPPARELLYNASLLAHYASTSVGSTHTFPSGPASLAGVFDTFVLDRSQHVDAEILEAAASQCLLLTGFFEDQQRRRHNIAWYAGLGASFYAGAARVLGDPARARLMWTMARRFGFWREQYRRLAVDLGDRRQLLARPAPPGLM